MKITEHFSSEEFRQHGTRFLVSKEYPVEWIQTRLLLLCEQLEVIRTELGGKMIHILSGYRSPEYNKAIGGAPKSQHMEGRAADIIVSGLKPSIVYDKIIELVRDKKIKIGGLGKYANFTHVDVRNVEKLVTWDETKD